MSPTIILCAALALCAALVASCLRTMTATEHGLRDPACWHAPLIFTSAAFALLAALGVVSVPEGIFLVLLPLAAIARMVWRPWRSLARVNGYTRASLRTLRGLADRVRDALWNAGQDLRALAGMLRHRESAPSAPRAYEAPPKGSLDALRAVPSVMANPDLGNVPAPAELAAELEYAGAALAPEWRAVADRAGDFEPESQGDFLAHLADESAGLLTYADAREAQAESLLEGRKLHPEFVAALLEASDMIAEAATVTAMAARKYHEVYGTVIEHHEAGGTLPEDARGWDFGE